MLVPDVNVLLNVQFTHQAHHARALDWLRESSEGDETVGFANLVLSAFVRIVTNTGAEGGQEVHHLHIHVMGGPRPWKRG